MHLLQGSITKHCTNTTQVSVQHSKHFRNYNHIGWGGIASVLLQLMLKTSYHGRCSNLPERQLVQQQNQQQQQQLQKYHEVLQQGENSLREQTLQIDRLTARNSQLQNTVVEMKQRNAAKVCGSALACRLDASQSCASACETCWQTQCMQSHKFSGRNFCTLPYGLL